MRKNMNLLFIRIVFFMGMFPFFVWGIRTHRISHHGYSNFVKGKLENVQLDSNGFLSNAPKLERIAGVDEPIIWKGICTDDGKLYLGTGNKGKILMIDGEGSSEVIFNPDEILSRALAVDDEGYIYAGTSPNGKVYRIPPGGGRAEIYFNPSETYIWDLLLDPAGNLYVAVGNGGKIYKLPSNYEKDSDAELWFDSGHTHLYKMAFDADGNLITGSGPKGYLFRITGQDKAEILYSTNDKEISQIVTMDSGEILFSTFSKKTVPKSGSSKSSPTTSSSSKSSSIPIYSKVYLMNQEGFVKNLWAPYNTSIFSVYPNSEDQWLLGTGQEGRLYSLDREGDWALIQTMTKGGQITDIHPIHGEADKFLIITSNPSNLYQVSMNESEKTQFTSQVMDAKHNAFWGKVDPVTLSPESRSNLKIETRTGNSPKPDKTWSNWKQTSENLNVQSPSGRFLQYKLGMEVLDLSVRKIDFYFHHENQRPEIRNINILPVGFSLLKNELKKVNLSYDNLISNPDPMKYLNAKTPPPKLILESARNAVTVGWKVSDSNKDILEHKIQIRKVGDKSWITLQDKLKETVFSTNTLGFEDGHYEIKVTTSDAPSNPKGMELSVNKTSFPFPIDTKAPEIKVVSQDVQEDVLSIQLLVKDEMSNVHGVAYKVGGDRIYRAFPSDNLFDSKEEEFEVNVDFSNSNIDKSILIEAHDESGNQSIQKIAF